MVIGTVGLELKIGGGSLPIQWIYKKEEVMMDHLSNLHLRHTKKEVERI
jgi:hypothetical protein